MDHPDAAVEDHGPVVRVDVSDLAPAVAARVLADALTRAAGCRAPFAAVVRMPSTTERPRAIGGVGERIRMLESLRPRLKEHCRGPAFVLSVQAQAANARSITSGARLSGCPTLATDDVGAATAWAGASLVGVPGGGA